MGSRAKEKRNDMIGAFNSTSRYLDDLLNIGDVHFEQMVPGSSFVKQFLLGASEIVSYR